MQTCVGIIDYGRGNICSVKNAFLALNVPVKLLHSPKDMQSITHLVLPGQGAFGDCMQRLNKSNFTPLIKDWIAQKRPFLGICVGYQLLFEGSEESPETPGLGLYKGQVIRFINPHFKIPHMGWNQIIDKATAQDLLWKGSPKEPFFYFVHSYYPQPEKGVPIAGYCDYAGVRFAAMVAEGNLLATQFHPEKSHQEGLRLLSTFLSFSFS